MPGYKEYKSVTEFPLHVNKLDRDELETFYLDLRDTYRSLVISRGQLVRRQTEAKQNLALVNQRLTQLTDTLKKVEDERKTLQKSLVHSVEVRKQLEAWGHSLSQDVQDLQAQVDATSKVLGEFEAVYEEIQQDTGVFTIWQRFQRLLAAAHRLLNTDLKALMAAPEKSAIARRDDPDDWKRDTPDARNRSLRDE